MKFSKRNSLRNLSSVNYQAMDNVQEHDPDTQEHNNETQNHKQEDHSNSYQTRTIPFIEPLSREYQKRIILCQTGNPYKDL